MSKPLKIGVAGLGRIGRLHAEILKYRVDAARLVAVNDIIKDLARSVGERLGVKWYLDYDEMLRDPEVEAVVITTPTFMHKDMIIKALELGKHVFVEKPLTVSSSEAKEVISKVKSSGMKLQVGYMRRFDYAYARAKKLIEEGGIGQPIAFISIARDPEAPPGWAADPSKSGGIFLDMLSHDFDMGRFIIGSEIGEVYVVGGNYMYEELKRLGDLDAVSIAFRFRNGVQGLIHGARRSLFGYELKTEIYGSDGTVYVGGKIDNMFAKGSKEGITYSGISWFERRFYDAYVEELREFAESVLNDRGTPVTALDGLRAVEIAEACWKSYREGRPVKVAE